MLYLQQNDYNSYLQNRFFIESQADNPTAFETIELDVITEVADRLSGRYNTDKIFNEDNPIRHRLLVKIITKITIYELIRRNAARKVPDDFKNDYEWAQMMLGKLESGTPKLKLPPPENTDGEPQLKNMWGNSTNKNYFI